MQIRKLRIENFMSIGLAELMLDDRGLVLIQGVNKDDSSASSNGAGKSTIPDAISWCLFGQTARGETGDAIVNTTEGANTRVQITLADPGDDATLYVVTRNRKHSHSKNRLTLGRIDSSGERHDLTGGTDRLTQALIERVIGCSESVFTSAIYAGQERMPDLPSMTDKELKELLEEAAGISELQGYYQTARERHGVIKTELATKNAALTAMNKTIEQATGWIVDFETSHKQWLEGHEKTLAAKQAEIDTTFALVTEEGLEVDVKVFTAAHKEAVIEYAKAKDEAARPDGHEEKLRSEFAESDRKVTTLEAAVKLSGSEILRLKRELETLDSRIGTPCGECGKPYGEDDLSTARKAQAAGLKGRVTLHKDKQQALAEARVARDLHRNVLETWLAKRPSLAEKQERVLALQENVHKIQNALNQTVTRLAELRKAKLELATLKKATSPFFDKLESARERLAEATAQVDEIRASVTKLTADLELHQKAVEVFGPAGVRAHILDNVTPYLNARTAQYLSTLSDGNLSAGWSTLSTTAKGDLRERFIIDVANALGGRSFGLLSGGEKRKVRLACALALQDLVATRASKPFRLFIADEIDDALDQAGLERLMAVLEEKARERGTVLVISHNSLSDWIREVVTVEKDGGKSTVRGSICPEK